MKYNLRSKLYLRNEKNENLRVDFIALEEIFRKNIKIAARIIYHTLRWKSAFSREFFNKDIYDWLYEDRGRKLDEFMFVVNIIQIFSLVHIEYSQLSTLTFSLSSFVLIFTRFSLSSIILQVSVTIERKTVPQEIDSFWDDKHDRTRGQTSVLIKWRIKQNVERNMDKRNEKKNGIRKKKEVGNEEEEEWRKEEGARQDLAVWFRIKYYDKNVAWITWKYAYAQYAVSLYRFCRMAHCVVLCSHVACFPNVTITVRPRSHCYLFPTCMYVFQTSS